MTPVKELAINNVMYVPEIYKSVGVWIAAEKSFCQKNEIFVGKGCVSDGLLRLNVMSLKAEGREDG